MQDEGSRGDRSLLIETSAGVLRDLLASPCSIDGFACVEVVIEDKEGSFRSKDLEDEQVWGEVFLLRVGGVWYALWTDTGPMIYGARKDGPAWYLVPAAEDCAAICAAPESVRPARVCHLVSESLGVPPPPDEEDGRILRVRATGTGEVLLELGVEWYAYQTRPVTWLPLVALSAQGALHGEFTVVTGHPDDGTFNVQRLLIVRDAGHWIIEDVLVGASSQLEVSCGELSGELFAPEAFVGLCIDPIDPTRPLSVRARYMGPDAAGGNLLCIAMLEGPEVTRLACRAVEGGSWLQDLGS